MSRTLLTSGLVLAAFASGCGAAAPAGAPEPVSTWEHRDAREDVYDEQTFRRVDGAANVDLVSTRVVRGRRALTVVVRYADLRRRASTGWGLDFEISSTEPLRRAVHWAESQYADTGGWESGLSMERFSTEDPFDNPCPGLRGGPDVGSRTIRFRVPNRCFGDPAWVQVGQVQAYARARHGHDVVDDALSTRDDSAVTSPRLVRPAN